MSLAAKSLLCALAAYTVIVAAPKLKTLAWRDDGATRCWREVPGTSIKQSQYLELHADGSVKLLAELYDDGTSWKAWDHDCGVFASHDERYVSREKAVAAVELWCGKPK